MTEYSRVANGTFVSTGGAQVVPLSFQPKRVQIRNITAWKNANTACIIQAFWNPLQVISNVNYTMCYGLNSTTAVLSDWVSTNGISTFSAGQLLQYGPSFTVTDVSKASAALVTTSAAHGLTSGDVVILEGLYQTTTTGMPQINGIPFTVTVVSTTTFTIPWNTNQSNYTTISGAATGTPRMKKVLYPYIYFPGTAVISAITVGTSTTIDTANAHNFRVGQEVAFRIPSQWGTTELNSLPNTLVPGSPVYGYVTSITDYNTVVVNIDSSAMTAFNSNQTVASVPGLSFAQIVAVGDVNTGGQVISAGSVLYPPPVYEPIGTTEFGTINGPAIRGAFVNNTSQGFIVGSGTANTLSTAKLCGAASDVIEWEAFYDDINGP